MFSSQLRSVWIATMRLIRRLVINLIIIPLNNLPSWCIVDILLISSPPFRILLLHPLHSPTYTSVYTNPHVHLVCSFLDVMCQVQCIWLKSWDWGHKRCLSFYTRTLLCLIPLHSNWWEVAEFQVPSPPSFTDDRIHLDIWHQGGWLTD